MKTRSENWRGGEGERERAMRCQQGRRKDKIKNGGREERTKEEIKIEREGEEREECK